MIESLKEEFDVRALVVIKRRAGTKGLRLSVASGGRVTLTMPRRLSLRAAEEFLRSQKDWILSAYARVLAHPPRLLTQGDEAEYRAHKEEARECITKRVTHYAAIYQVTPRRIAIRNQRSRFGSCSAQGNLNFNYRLIFLPPALFDYVIVHELCHLRELNHSSRFWVLVARTIPDYQVRKRELQAFSRPSSDRV